jgi:two-component system OmpR family response regulator
MLPGEDGLVLCRDVRAISNVPIIMLTAHGDEADRIVGLEMGADDYLPKPFNPRELLARIKSVLRRARSLPQSMRKPEVTAFRFAAWTLAGQSRRRRSGRAPHFAPDVCRPLWRQSAGVDLGHEEKIAEED